MQNVYTALNSNFQLVEIVHNFTFPCSKCSCAMWTPLIEVFNTIPFRIKRGMAIEICISTRNNRFRTDN